MDGGDAGALGNVIIMGRRELAVEYAAAGRRFQSAGQIGRGGTGYRTRRRF